MNENTNQPETNNESTTETNNAFKPITTQEEFDAAIKARIDRAKKSAVPSDYDELKAKAAKWDEIEEANKSDLEKATQRAEAAEAKLNEIQHENELRSWREAASKATGVPASVLRGDTEADIMAHAEAIKNTMPIYPQVNETGTQPDTMTRSSIMAIKDTQKRQAAIAAHPELF